MRYLLLGISFLVFVGCASKKKTVEPTGTPKDRSAAYLVKQIEKQVPDYQTLKTDVQLEGEFEGTQMKLRGKLIHINDSLIWMNLTKFGIEVGRVMVTRDSFYMMNRLLREYIAEPISYIEEEYQIVPDFDVLENLLVGVPTFPSIEEPNVDIVGPRHRLEGGSGVEDVILTVWLNGFNHNMDQAMFEDDRGRRIKIEYDPGRNGKNLVSRSFRTENLDSEDYAVSCTFDKATYNEPQQPKFVIPKKYDRVR